MNDSVRAYQLSALRATLRIASENPFYKRKWKDQIASSARGEGGVELDRLPILTKEELKTELRPMVGEGDKIASIIHTTGSTGPVTYRYRSQGELDRIAEFGKSVVRNIRAGNSRPLAYMLYGPYHGQNLPGPGPIGEGVAPYYFAGAIWDDIFIRQGVEQLRREFTLPGLESRVTQVHGAVRLLRIFTQCLIDMQVPVGETKVEAVVSFAGYMPSEVRRFLGRYWNCNPIETFSFSETFGGATKCPHCNGLQFMPHLLPQVVELDADNPAHSGIGRLLITELYPFGTTQPLIKYFNGDLVRIVDEQCPTCGTIGSLVHVGRDNESCFVESPQGRRLALGSMDLREAAYTPEVKRTVEFPHLKLLKDRESHLGAPVLAAHTKCEGAKTRLTVSFLPNLGLGISQSNLADRLRNRLLEVSPELRATVGEGLVDLDVQPEVGLEKILWK